MQSLGISTIEEARGWARANTRSEDAAFNLADDYMAWLEGRDKAREPKADRPRNDACNTILRHISTGNMNGETIAALIERQLDSGALSEADAEDLLNKLRV